MANSLNKVTLVGNIGRDPEVRSFQNGSKVCNLSLATSERWKDKETNEPKEKTTEEVMKAKESEGDGSEGNEDIESIIKLKEETDTWLIEQLKNKGDNGSERELRAEVAELRDRVQKLENIIKNLTKAFE